MEESGDPKFVIRALAGRLAVVRLDPGSEVPEWAQTGSLCAALRTPGELTIVCDQTGVPDREKAERDWVALMVEGPLSLSMTGVLASLLEPLAAGQIAVFVLSSFDTDYILVKAAQSGDAMEALRREGHQVL